MAEQKICNTRSKHIDISPVILTNRPVCLQSVVLTDLHTFLIWPLPLPEFQSDACSRRPGSLVHTCTCAYCHFRACHLSEGQVFFRCPDHVAMFRPNLYRCRFLVVVFPLTGHQSSLSSLKRIRCYGAALAGGWTARKASMKRWDSFWFTWLDFSRFTNRTGLLSSPCIPTSNIACTRYLH